MRAGAVAVSAVAFGWVIVQAQGGCGTESPTPAESQPEKTPAPQVDPKPSAEVPVEAATPEPRADPPSETPTAKLPESEAANMPPAFFPASKSGAVNFDHAESAGAGVGGIRPPEPGTADKGNNAGRKSKPKAFFPASKSGRVKEPAPQHPNAPPK